MRQKFMNQPGAQRELLRTGNKIIAEASCDTYWGSGPHKTNDSALDMEAWEGKNKMGEILMGIRNEMQQLMNKCRVLQMNSVRMIPCLMLM